MIIHAFNNKTFSFYNEKRFDDEDEDVRDEDGFIDYSKRNRLISLKNRDLNDDLIRKHFQVQNLRALFKKLLKLKNKRKNNIQVSLIKSGLRDL